VILSNVTALVALAVLRPARLPTIPMVGGRRAQTDAQPESAKAQRAHDRGSRRRFLETHCCAPSVLWAYLRIVSTDPKAGTARDRLTLDRRLRFEEWRCSFEDASHCNTAAQSCDVRPSLALSRYPPGLLPKSVVGWITHRSADVGVLKPILPATFSDLYDPGQVNTTPPRASTGT
jgi:hypothetical protein